MQRRAPGLGRDPDDLRLHDLVGKTVNGKYVIRRVLGGGGMGAVFEAEHLIVGRRVAVKVLHPVQAKKREAVRRFYREARAAGCIDHPNVCDVYDFDLLPDGTPYFVMEKLVGETMACRITRDRKLPLGELMDIVLHVLSALMAAHDKGIVHRDVKPENVFLARRPGRSAVAKLLDFGVSKTLGVARGSHEDEVDLTRKGMVMGTPYYMSPEQVRGDRDLDARVDLYACGVILYEGLTGHRPFEASSYGALLREVLRGTATPARELRRELPGGLEPILARAMARSRDDRYRTATEFQRDLQALRDRHRHPPLPPKVIAPRLPIPMRSADADDHPTHLWVRRPREVDDAAPTHIMRRPLRPALGKI
jgi:serine/threonine protein kinase